MINAVLKLVESGIQFKNVGYIVAVYIALLWVFFCIWVFFDAKKRYENTVTAALFFVAVLILNFPMLILYLIVRPEHEEVFAMPGEHHYSSINVPMVNFVSEKGIEMSLNLRINNSLLKDNLPADGIKVDLNIDHPEDMIVNKEMNLGNKEVTTKESEGKKKSETLNNFKAKFGNFKIKFPKRAPKDKSEKKEEEKNQDKKENAVEVVVASNTETKKEEKPAEVQEIKTEAK